MRPFTCVTTGSDLFTYQTARAIHALSGTITHSISSSLIRTTRHSAIINSICDFSYHDEDRMMDAFMNFGRQHTEYGKPLLIASGENDLSFFYQHPELQNVFEIPYFMTDVGNGLQNKTNFYQAAEKAGISHPKTIRVEDKKHLENYRYCRFPAVLKPENTSSFRPMKFEGKWKVYTLDSFSDFIETVEQIGAMDFQGTLLLQNYISGPLSNEYSFTGYVDRDGKFRDAAIGRALIDDPDPDMRGNHLGIVQVDRETRDEILGIMENYVRCIGYHGFINADFKRDAQSDRLFILEVNQRQGASAFYTTLAGANIFRGVLEDYVEEKPYRGTRLGENPYLWVDCSLDLLRGVLQGDARTLYEQNLSSGNVGHTLLYEQDDSPERRAAVKEYIEAKDREIREHFERYDFRQTR